MKPGGLVQDEITHVKLDALLERLEAPLGEILHRAPTLRDQWAMALITRVNMTDGVESAIRVAYDLADIALKVRE